MNDSSKNNQIVYRIGILMVCTGVICNVWILGLFNPDHAISELKNWILIWCFDVGCVTSGVLAIKYRSRIKLRIIPKVVLKITIVMVITFLALEQATRFYLFGFSSLSYEKMNSVHALGVAGVVQASKAPGVIYELKPGLDTWFKMAPFKTNSQGLRDKEYSLEKPANTYRVAVLGSSFTLPAGVAIEDAFHSILEDRLSAESPDIDYEFINFGVGGYDTRQYLATLKHKALVYNPDMVMVCLSVSVTQMYPEEYYHQEYKVKPRTFPFFSSFFLERMCSIKRTIQASKRNKHKDAEEESEGQVSLQEGYENIQKIFNEFQEISQLRNMPICLVFMQYPDLYREEYEEVKRMAEESGIDVIDTVSAFKGIGISEHIIYKSDAHPNAKANRIFADVIYGQLKSIMCK